MTAIRVGSLFVIFIGTQVYSDFSIEWIHIIILILMTSFFNVTHQSNVLSNESDQTVQLVDVYILLF